MQDQPSNEMNLIQNDIWLAYYLYYSITQLIIAKQYKVKLVRIG